MLTNRERGQPRSEAPYKRYEFSESGVTTGRNGTDDIDGSTGDMKCSGMEFVVAPLDGLSRVKSLFTFGPPNVSVSDCSFSSDESSPADVFPTSGLTTAINETTDSSFLSDMKRSIGYNSFCPDFSSSSTLRKVMEPHFRRVRLLREAARGDSVSQRQVAASIASSMGVPYTALRRECPFLFDEHTHPLHIALAKALRVQDLSQVHHVAETELLLPLLDRGRRLEFHSTFDAFVTTFCIPLLHSMALSKRVVQQSTTDRIVYRYQAFPSIQVSRPGSSALLSPICDSISGHTVGCLTFFVPLTPCEGTNCMFIESHPGKEDWHPLTAKSIGLGYLVDGARCLHFDLVNTTEASRVSLMFRVIVYREGEDAPGLCPNAIIDDAFTASGYYDEVVVDLQQRTESLVWKKSSRLLDPSPFVGYPFV